MENLNEEIRGCFKVIDCYLGTMQQMHADTGTQCLVSFFLINSILDSIQEGLRTTKLMNWFCGAKF